MLARYGRKSNKKDTTQRSIPFDRIYPDGLCKVSEDYYTSMIEFEDVNYTLLEDSGREYFLSEYENVFCYFDSDTHAEMFMFNRRTDGSELNSMLDIPLKNDSFDEIRKEYLGVIRSQASKGTNS